MTSITVRNIEDDLKRRLRIRAAEHGHSMEEEARRILRSALGEDETLAKDAVPEKDLGTAIHELFAPLGVRAWAWTWTSRRVTRGWSPRDSQSSIEPPFRPIYPRTE